MASDPRYAKASDRTGHAEEIQAELGFADGEIDRMIGAGVSGGADEGQ
ncbi:hypothetical protein [Futiania mangrovi]|uniref:Uncharacterized protein n=1 Tax=Futiania mangrovi TaxID=2959716 RepID=A0A9J6PAW9_9PROT|nr:hypothetical protein [Futiania mangrovii]MCP1336285.1 hypothetical protein [Futiania mangrovii]